MKRIYTLTTLFLFAFLTGGNVSGQETKEEKHIKIVTVDETGKKIEIDTLIKNGVIPDTIVLKNGKVVVLGSHNSLAGKLTHVSEGSGKIYVTVSSDLDDEKGEKGEKGEKITEKKIIIYSGDGGEVVKRGEAGDVIILKSGDLSGEKGEKTVTWSSSESGSQGASYVYINGGKSSVKSGGKSYDVRVITDEEGNTVEKTKYVIAKNGMVITIEGNDEAKVKEMIKDIESKLGIAKSDDNKKTVVKEETKKTTKR